MVGATIAAVLIGIVMLFVNFPVGLIVWVIYAIVFQQIENYLIQPQIQKRATKIEPFITLVAVLFGSTLFGVVGAILAIPTAATIQIVDARVHRLPPRGTSRPGRETSPAPATAGPRPRALRSRPAEPEVLRGRRPGGARGRGRAPRSRWCIAHATTTGRCRRASSTPGEGLRLTPLLREVEEETGLRCELGAELEPARYRDRKGREKLVRYFRMRPLAGRFEPSDEVDELRWLAPAAGARSCWPTSMTASWSQACSGLRSRLVVQGRTDVQLAAGSARRRRRADGQVTIPDGGLGRHSGAPPMHDAGAESAPRSSSGQQAQAGRRAGADG